MDQIPSTDESELEFCNNQNNLKFNHVYTSKIASPECGSDINEELSINGTERTSELTTEHCSESKLCQSQKPIACVGGAPTVYLVNLPSLSLKYSNRNKDFENPFKKKQSTNASSVVSQTEDVKTEAKDENLTSMMNMTFGKEV